MRSSKRRGIGILLILFLTACTSPSAVRTLDAHGHTYVPMKSIASYFSMTVSQPAPDRIRLKNKWHTLEFETNSRRCWVNGTMLWLNNPLRRVGSQWGLQEPDFSKTLDPSIRPYVFLKNVGRRIVVLDPGHGGDDKGAVSPRKIYEKLLTKNIATRVRDTLKSRGVTVYLTRETDKNVSLTERGKIAARHRADVFVSLHADSASATAEGASTFVLSLPKQYSTHSYGQGSAPSAINPGNKYDKANQALGTRIQEKLIQSTGQNDRGVKRARFQVLREAPCPAALVEMAFITNPKEEAFVLSKSGQEKIAKGIADGILAYLADVKRAK